MKEAKTVIIKILAATFFVALLFYFSATLLVFSINGDWNALQINHLTIYQQFYHLFESVISYWKFYIDNSDVLNSDSHNNFVAKLWLVTLFPILLLLVIIWLFGEKFIQWQPFKNN